MKFYINFRKEYHLNIQVCVGHGKTTLFTDVLQPHEKIQNTKHTTIYLSESDEVAIIRLKQIVNMLKYYGTITKQPFTFLKNNERDFRLKGNKKRDPSGQARGILSKYTGSHVNSIIMDDIETLDTIPDMKRIQKAVDIKVNKRLAPTGKMCAINTPYMPNGVVSNFEQRNSWLTLKISFSEEPILENVLETIIKEFQEEENLPEHIKDKVLEYLLEKLIFNAISVLRIYFADKKEQFYKYKKKIKSCLDFRYRMKIIERGSIIEEKILPEWEYFIETHGQEVLDSFLYTNISYMQTYALTANVLGYGGFFTAYLKALAPLEKIKEIKAKDYKRVFSYDLSTGKRKGTVIIESIFTEDEFLILSQKSTLDNIYAVRENIIFYPDDLHIVENNSWQSMIIEQAKEQIPEAIHKNILEHTTPSKSHQVLRSKLDMNRAFGTREILIAEEGEGIEELKSDLNSFNGIKKGKNQFDKIDALWFLHHNRELIRSHINYENKPKEKKMKYKKRLVKSL